MLAELPDMRGGVKDPDEEVEEAGDGGWSSAIGGVWPEGGEGVWRWVRWSWSRDCKGGERSKRGSGVRWVTVRFGRVSYAGARARAGVQDLP